MCSERKEAEVGIHFDLTKMTKEQRDLIYSAAQALKAAGIGFDTGQGCGEIDWEWDWSLSGPVKVSFKCFVEDNPKNRYTRKHEIRSVEEQVAGVCAVKEMAEEAFGKNEEA